jgi:hypothetical protein
MKTFPLFNVEAFEALQSPTSAGVGRPGNLDAD